MILEPRQDPGATGDVPGEGTNPFDHDAGDPSEAAAAPAPLAAICGGSETGSSVAPEQVTAALRNVLDPELGMSVVELGLVYGTEIEGGRVSITMTLTAPGCPIHDAMADWVRQAVMKIPGVSEVEVTITFDPPWTPDRITLGPANVK